MDNNEGFAGLAQARPGMNISHYYWHTKEARAKVKDSNNGKHWYEVSDVNDLLDALYIPGAAPVNIQKGKVHAAPLGAKDGDNDERGAESSSSPTIFDFYPNNCPAAQFTADMEPPRDGCEYYVDDNEGNLGQRMIPVRAC